MFLITRDYIGETNGARHCVIQADETPTTFPLNGENVMDENCEKYLGESFKFAPGSMLVCVDSGKTYFLNQAGTAWNEYGGNA